MMIRSTLERCTSPPAASSAKRGVMFVFVAFPFSCALYHKSLSSASAMTLTCISCPLAFDRGSGTIVIKQNAFFDAISFGNYLTLFFVDDRVRQGGFISDQLTVRNARFTKNHAIPFSYPFLRVCRFPCSPDRRFPARRSMAARESRSGRRATARRCAPHPSGRLPSLTSLLGLHHPGAILAAARNFAASRFSRR